MTIVKLTEALYAAKANLDDKDALIAELVRSLNRMTIFSEVVAQRIAEGHGGPDMDLINEEIAAARAVLDRAKEQKP